MAKKVLIGAAAGVVAVAATAGIVVLAVNLLGTRPSSRSDIWDDDDDEETSETSYYRENPDPTPTTPRETQGRDYYENGGYKGMDSYFIIQDYTVDEIVAEYEYYHDLAHSYDINEIRNFDQELEHPAYSQVDSTGFGIYMFYDLILPDEKIDHVVCFNIEGNGSTGEVDFSMKIRIHDQDRAMEIFNTFVDRYSAGAQEVKPYNMMNTFDNGVWITVNDTESRAVCYRKLRDNGDYYWIIYVSEDY